VAVSITRRVTRYARLLEMCDVPEKGRDHRAGSVATDPAGTNLAWWHGRGSSGLSHAERKIIGVEKNATRLLSSIDPFSERWCSSRSRRSELRSISPGRPRRSAPGLCLCSARQPPGGSEVLTCPSGRRKASPRAERPSEGGPTGTTDLLGGAVAGAERAVRVCILPSEHANQLRRIFGVSGGEASI